MSKSMFEKISTQIYGAKVVRAVRALIDAMEFDPPLADCEKAIYAQQILDAPTTNLITHAGLGLCESEIERVLLTNFVLNAGQIHPLFFKPSEGFNSQDIDAVSDLLKYPHSRVILITPQKTWKKYRIDFEITSVLFDPGSEARLIDKTIFVECDGHDFHERTKDQAKRDRSKDRAIQSAGIKILRFTGSEIWSNPLSCTNEILAAIGLDECENNSAGQP
jgi:very-short-patch-repair endonuclease